MYLSFRFQLLLPLYGDIITVDRFAVWSGWRQWQHILWGPPSEQFWRNFILQSVRALFVFEGHNWDLAIGWDRVEYLDNTTFQSQFFEGSVSWKNNDGVPSPFTPMCNAELSRG